jgi:hypothetical protein
LLREGSRTPNQGNRNSIRGNAFLQAHGFLPEALYKFCNRLHLSGTL